MRRAGRRDGGPRFRTGVLAGAIGLGLPIAVQVALMPVLGDGVLLFLLFFVCLIPGFGVALVWSGGRIWRLALGALLLLLLPFASLALPEARILGGIATVAPAEAPGRPAAAGFRLPGAAPAEALQREVAATSTSRPRDQRGHRGAAVTERGRFLVAPVVGAGWTPADPVPVVVVQDLDDGAAAPWAAPGGVLRLLPDRLLEAAVRMALREAGLAPAPGMVVGRWVESPGWARLHAARDLLLLYAGGLLAWTLMLATARRGE